MTTVTIILSGKDGKDRKHGVVQTFCIYEVIVDLKSIVLLISSFNLGYYEIAGLS
jgi:hypothetical protein